MSGGEAGQEDEMEIQPMCRQTAVNNLNYARPSSVQSQTFEVAATVQW